MMSSIKKILAIAIAIILIVASFAACGRKEEETSGSDDEISSKADPSEEPEDEKPSEKPSKKPSEEPSEKPSEEPAEEPTPKPTPTPQETMAPADPTPGAADETQADADAVLGSVKNGKYANEYFGFSVMVPDGWYVATREEFAQILSITADYLNSSGDATIDLTQQQMIPLFFAALENPFTSTSGSNPHIVCLGQNIGPIANLIPDVATFINMSMQQIIAQGINMEFGEVETLMVDGQEVGKVTGVYNLQGTGIRQTMYVFIRNDYVVNFTLSSFSDQDAALMDQVMNSIRFK